MRTSAWGSSANACTACGGRRYRGHDGEVSFGVQPQRERVTHHLMAVQQHDGEAFSSVHDDGQSGRVATVHGGGGSQADLHGARSTRCNL